MLALSAEGITLWRPQHYNDECFLLGDMWRPWLLNNIGMVMMIGVVEWAGF